MTTRSTVELTDTTGLRFERHGKARKNSKAAAPLVAEFMPPPLLPQSAAFERRRRMLEFLCAACDSDVILHTIEKSECSGRLVAVDAEQENLVVDGLATPMGVYPRATVRTGDLLRAELHGDWHVSCPLPLRPSWVDDEEVELLSAAADGDGDGGDGDGGGGDGDGDGDANEAESTATIAVCTAAAVSAGANDGVPAPLEKYYLQRYMLFSRYDAGVRIDEEGWYSVTPEVLAAHMAERCRCDLIVDAFCGVGGNAIQFAYVCERVVAVDLDASRLSIARHNAGVYDVADRIEWVNADFFTLEPRLRADVVFLSPPWGGPEYQSAPMFDVTTMMGGLDGAEILRSALAIAPSVCYFLPKNTDEAQVEALAREAGVRLELERCSLNGHVKGLVAYFGFEEEDEG